MKKLILLLVISVLFTGCSLFKKKAPVSPVNIVPDRAEVKVVLTPDNIRQYNDITKCDEKFNFDPADTNINYYSPDKGIAVDLPYNSHWGSATYSVAPYDEQADFVAFGPMGPFEACSWARSYFVHFKPAVATAEVIASLEEGVKSEQLVINDLTVVKYTTQGMCTYPTMQVLGKKYNYEFRPLCGSDTNIDSEFEYLTNIIKTVKLID